jgi:hypothetical protein
LEKLGKNLFEATGDRSGFGSMNTAERIAIDF